MTTIKTLFFDIGGVLVNIHPEKALELAEAKKETSLLVDDKIENIDAARMLGFQTVHYRSHAECLKAITNMLDI